MSDKLLNSTDTDAVSRNIVKPPVEVTATVEQDVADSVAKSCARDAFSCDLPIDACPYQAGSQARAVWIHEYAVLSNHLTAWENSQAVL